jgi:hypothetical protein
MALVCKADNVVDDGNHISTHSSYVRKCKRGHRKTDYAELTLF